ncbi:MAG: Uma2 family endonuclease [Hyphomicrobiaceae bacterium]|nr:Uma2 family endonuclease [Hyphomicrobiaceae bacterium]
MNMIRPQRRDRIDLADFDEMLLNKPEEEKWELIDGRIIKSMVGARWEHHLIVSNIQFALENHLRGQGSKCRVFRETFFLKKASDQLAALPDVFVHCGPLTPDQASVDDALLLFEVLSPGTAANDRMIKRVAYQRLESLQSYVLVERDQPLIDIYRRKSDGWHGDPPLQCMSDRLRLPEIDFEMTLADVYRDVISDIS